MRCAPSSAMVRSIARARARRTRVGDFPTAALGEICGWTVDDERVALWMKVWTRSWTKSLVRAQGDADDAQVASKEGTSGGGGADRVACDRVHRVLLPAPLGRMAPAL